MNLPLPFEHEPWSFAALVGIVVLVLVIVYVALKRNKVI